MEVSATWTSVGSGVDPGVAGSSTSPVWSVRTFASAIPSPLRSTSISNETSDGLIHSPQVAIPNQTVAAEEKPVAGIELAAPTNARSAAARVAVVPGFFGLSRWSSKAETVETTSTGGAVPVLRPVPASGIVNAPPAAGAARAREAAFAPDCPRATTWSGTRRVPAGAPASVTTPPASAIQKRFERGANDACASSRLGGGACVTAVGSARTTFTSNVALPPAGTVRGAAGTSTRTPGSDSAAANPGVSVTDSAPLFTTRTRRVTVAGAVPSRKAARLTSSGRSSLKATTCVATARAGSVRPAPTRAGPWTGSEPPGA